MQNENPAVDIKFPDGVILVEPDVSYSSIVPSFMPTCSPLQHTKEENQNFAKHYAELLSCLQGECFLKIALKNMWCESRILMRA